jgi:hypothetical protein
MATNKRKPYHCWLAVDLDEVADDGNLDCTALYKLNPIQRLLVKLVQSWPEWAKYCSRYEVELDIQGKNAAGITLLRGGKGVLLGPVAWPPHPYQFTTLRQAFRDLLKTLGISVVEAKFVSRDTLPPPLIKREQSGVKTKPDQEIKIKAEPEFTLAQRTTALPNQVQLVDLTGDSSDSDDSFPELLEVVSHVIVKEKEEEKVNKQVIKPGLAGHKREGSRSTSKPPGNTTKRSKLAVKTNRSKRTNPKRQAKLSIVRGGNSKGRRARREKKKRKG